MGVLSSTNIQVLIFVLITTLIGVLTFIQCHRAKKNTDHSTKGENKEVFLAGGGLSWIFVAGSITLTNLSTDQLVGMNGNQMALLAWWEFAAVAGLIILAKVFLPVYYRYECTTTTELLEKRYGSHVIRAFISMLFLLGNVFITIPAILYGGSLFMQSMFDVQLPIIVIALLFALTGAAYAVFGGLRAVAVSDAYSGVLLLGLGMLVVLLAMMAIDFDFSGIPADRLTLIGDNDSPIPWHTLLTGMIFMQMFYWSTNQNITQRAMASPTLQEGQKGVYAAAAIRFLLVPPMIVIPGIVSYKLYGDIGDAAYGRIVGDVLPAWLSGAFAAAVAAAVLTSVNSILNSSVTLYVCDLHEKYVGDNPNVPRLNAIITTIIVSAGLALVPLYAKAESLINIIQQLYALLSMPILSAFLVCLIFRNVDYRASVIAVISGVVIYALLSFVWMPFHFIHMAFVTLVVCIVLTLTLSRWVFQSKPELEKANCTWRDKS